jgi:hypothetical protein
MQVRRYLLKFLTKFSSKCIKNEGREKILAKDLFPTLKLGISGMSPN